MTTSNSLLKFIIAPFVGRARRLFAEKRPLEMGVNITQKQAKSDDLNQDVGSNFVIGFRGWNITKEFCDYIYLVKKVSP